VRAGGERGEKVRGENAKMEVAKLSLWPYQGAIPEQMVTEEGLRRPLLDIPRTSWSAKRG